MEITEVAKTASVKNPHNVDVRKVFEAPSTSVVIITLKPDAIERSATKKMPEY